jgi:GNAT superfamily N-acetyltransferase
VNRDELLELCFGRPVDDLPRPEKYLVQQEFDDENPQIVHVRALVGIAYRSVLVRASSAPGAGIGVAATVVRVGAVMNVCTDPDHRGKGYATALLRSAHEEITSHRTLSFAALFADPALAGFFERPEFGYQHPELAPERFYVAALTDEQWPSASVDTRGSW